MYGLPRTVSSRQIVPSRALANSQLQRPAAAGALTDGESMAPPLIIGAAMKITYDVLLYFAFRKVRPPEET